MVLISSYLMAFWMVLFFRIAVQELTGIRIDDLYHWLMTVILGGAIFSYLDNKKKWG